MKRIEHQTETVIGGTTYTFELCTDGSPHRAYSSRRVDFQAYGVADYCKHISTYITEGLARNRQFTVKKQPAIFVHENGGTTMLDVTDNDWYVTVASHRCISCLFAEAGEEATPARVDLARQLLQEFTTDKIRTKRLLMESMVKQRVECVAAACAIL